MVYEKPSVKLYQEFAEDTNSNERTLYPVFVGPNYKTRSYTNAKDNILAGIYDPTITNTLSYPNKATSEIIDPTMVKLYMDRAELEYHNKVKAIGVYDYRIVSGFKNKISTAASNLSNRLVFRTSTNGSGTTFNRSSVFDGRDVTRNDVLEIDGFKAQVSSLESETVESSIGTATLDADNQTNQSHSVGAPVPVVHTGDDTMSSSGTYIGSLENNVLQDVYNIKVINPGGAPSTTVVPNAGVVDTLTVSRAFYDASIPEVYTVEVTTGGAPATAQITVTETNGGTVFGPFSFTAFGADHDLGDDGLKFRIADTSGDGLLTLGNIWEVSVVPSPAVLQIVSESGTDDLVSRVFPGFTYSFPLTDLGINIAITNGGDSTLTLNDEWSISAAKAIAQVTATSSGYYEGALDTTYIAEVVQGGVWGNCQIKVTSTGVDASGPSLVTNHSVPVATGNQNVFITFATNTQGGLILGDKYYIPCVAEKEGAYKTIVLNKSLPTSITSLDTPATGSTVPNPGNSVVNPTSVLVSGSYDDAIEHVLSKWHTEIYTVEITTGGAHNVAMYTVTTTSGLDNQVATLITDNTGATLHNVGALGKQITFTNATDTFVAGDKWTFTITKQNLSVSARILVNDRLISRYKEDAPGEYAWTPTTTNVTIEQDIMLKHSTWNSGTVAIPVKTADVYIQYQAFVPSSNVIQTMSANVTKEEIESIIGSVEPEDVLGYGVYNGSINSGDNPIKYLGLTLDSEEGWDRAITLLSKEKDIKYIAVLSTDENIILKFRDHVSAMSTETKKKWRRAFVAMEIPTRTVIYETYNDPIAGAVDYTCKVIANPNDSNNINMIEANTEQGIDFVTSGVKAGDEFRYFYQTDINGNVTYTSYTISEVYNQNAAKISTNLSVPVDILSKFEIYKILTKDEKVNYVKAFNAKLNKRMCSVFPDTFENDDGNIVPSMFMAAGIAGLKNSVDAQQGITRFNITNVSKTPDTYNYYTEADLDILAEGGSMIVSQESETDVPFIRHQLTADTSREENAELSVGDNIDNISYYLDDQLAGFIGIYNITESSIDEIRARINTAFETKKEIVNQKIGPQITSGQIDYITQNATQKTKLQVGITYYVPAPLNNLEVHQTILL